MWENGSEECGSLTWMTRTNPTSSVAATWRSKIRLSYLGHVATQSMLPAWVTAGQQRADLLLEGAEPAGAGAQRAFVPAEVGADQRAGRLDQLDVPAGRDHRGVVAGVCLHACIQSKTQNRDGSRGSTYEQ